MSRIIKKKIQYYRVQLRRAEAFTKLIPQYIGKSKNLIKILGQKPTGETEIVSWLINKKDAYISANKNLIIINQRAKVLLESIYGPMEYKGENLFRAMPKYFGANVKPTVKILHVL